MEDRFLPIREFQMRPNAIRVTDLAYIQGVSINFNQHFPSSKKLSLHKLSIKQLPIDSSVGYELRSSTNKCKQSNNIDQHTFLSEWSFHLYIFIFSNVLFHFFESITNRWTKVVVQHFWDTLYVLGRGIGLEIRSRFESRSKIESVIALHRWHGGRGEGFCSKRHVFERIPGLLRTLYLYVREDPSVCRDPRRLFVPDTEIMGGNSASLRNVASGGQEEAQRYRD